MKEALKRLNAKFLTVFGDIRYSKVPPFIFYDDISFEVKGEQVEELSAALKKGDILLRGFDHYLDSLFIRSTRKYSHAGIYVGDGKVVHAVSPSVCMSHVIDFCQCDRVAVLRPRCGGATAVKHALKVFEDNVPYDFAFGEGSDALYCFELAAYCYPKLNIEKKTPTALFGIMRRKEKVYLSDSFLESADFKLIYEFNPRFNIYLRK